MRSGEWPPSGTAFTDVVGGIITTSLPDTNSKQPSNSFIPTPLSGIGVQKGQTMHLATSQTTGC